MSIAPSLYNMRVMIFNDVQNFNGSLSLLNNRFKKDEKRFWDYKKYIPFLINKLRSLQDFNNINFTLIKAFFYQGSYSNNLIKNFKWSCHQKINKINQLISKEQYLLNIISQSKVSNILRKKVNSHVEKIKEDLVKENAELYFYIEKQERNFEGQKKFLKELENNPIIEIKSTPLKQSDGEVYQKGIDVLLAIDLVHLAHIDAYDVAIILSGDTDLIEAVKLVKSLGKTIIIFAYHTSGDPEKSNISDLMTYGKFINLKDLTNEEIGEMSKLRVKE